MPWQWPAAELKLFRRGQLCIALNSLRGKPLENREVENALEKLSAFTNS
jgi:hypothetical protein